MMRRFDNLITGQWTATADYLPDCNPSEQADIIGEFASSDAGDVGSAIAAARAAFPAWSTSGVQQRFDLLDTVANELLARRAELADLLAREEGKTLGEAIGEIVRAGQIFKFFAGETLRSAGELVTATRPNLLVEITREPVGVVALITPWNFPMAISAWKIAPALAYGAAVVFKPAEWTPGCAHALADIISRAGAPPGVFNLVMGRGSSVGAALVRHADVDAISFTGSVAVGRGIAATAVARMAKVQLEMGAKTPLSCWTTPISTLR